MENEMDEIELPENFVRDFLRTHGSFLRFFIEKSRPDLNGKESQGRRWEAMEQAIIEILRAVGVYDFVMSKVKDQTEMVELFENYFLTLVGMCQE